MGKTIDAKIADLVFDDKNFNVGTPYGQSLIENSFRKFGAGRSILLDKNNRIIAGNKSVENAGAIGMDDVQIVESDGSKIIAVRRTDIDLDTKQGREMALADNATAKHNIVFDAVLVEATLGDAVCQDWNIIVPIGKAEAGSNLQERFTIPPFSILDTRQGYWQDRKKNWNALIDDKGESREETLYSNKGNPVSNHLRTFKNGVSILDPVLAEIVNKWFGFDGCSTFDCFAGDSIFGYVSSHMGHPFTGIELRQEQADLNNARIAGFPASKYICDDGQNVATHILPDSQDLLFSCPPYFDLELYSDLPNDASNQKTYKDFIKILHNAFTAAIQCLRNNRFAVITVGDIRDGDGFYYRFVDDIKDIFKASGMKLYNELILVESIGASRLRVPGAMRNRKIIKCHQNVLVFYKGDPRKIKDIFPEIETPEIDDDSTDA